MVADLATTFSTSNIRSMLEDKKSDMSNIEVVKALWSLVSLLQACVGNERIEFSDKVFILTSLIAP